MIVVESMARTVAEMVVGTVWGGLGEVANGSTCRDPYIGNKVRNGF